VNVVARLDVEGIHTVDRSGEEWSIHDTDVTVVDTTGAGDTHSGVFLAGLAAGLPPEEAAGRANAAAALAVTRPGPATAPARAQLDAFLRAR
jgi:sugar/nucleoside kinase (ribokinase family)